MSLQTFPVRSCTWSCTIQRPIIRLEDRELCRLSEQGGRTSPVSPAILSGDACVRWRPEAWRRGWRAVAITAATPSSCCTTDGCVTLALAMSRRKLRAQVRLQKQAKQNCTSKSDCGCSTQINNCFLFLLFNFLFYVVVRHILHKADEVQSGSTIL